MRVLRIDAGAPPSGDLAGPVATIGNFDGLHQGHRAIIGEAREQARRAGRPALVLSFDPHPVKVLHPGASFCCIKTLEQRLRGLERLGVDVVALLRFDAELAALSPRQFAERVLVGALGVSAVLVGPNFRFGQRRAGDVAALRALGEELGFAARAVEPVLLGGQKVSSTRIREALARGEVGAARELLGEPFEIEGSIVRGKGRGRSLGFPTANLETRNECLPAPGVYATRAELQGREAAAATFLGRPATFGDSAPVIETHLLDWPPDDLYGQGLRLRFLARLRGEQAFASPAELRERIAADLAAARALAGA